MSTEEGETTDQSEVGSISKMLKFLMEEIQRLKQEKEIAMERYRRDDKLTEKRQKHAEMFFFANETDGRIQ